MRERRINRESLCTIKEKLARRDSRGGKQGKTGTGKVRIA
jgi:hypothetical protein